MTILDDVLVQLRLRARFRWGRVTGLSPLMVQLDGDTAPLAPSDTLVDPAGLVVGDRVRCEMSMLRLVVHARVVAATATRAGFAELATQAEVDAGADTTRIVTPATLRGRAYAPFAEASGVAASSGAAGSSSAPVYWDGGTTVDFPSGRFTSAPAVVVTAGAGGQVYWASLTTPPTTSQCTVRLMRVGAAPGSDVPIHWHAVQMTG